MKIIWDLYDLNIVKMKKKLTLWINWPSISSDCCRVGAGERLFLPVETTEAEPASLSLDIQKKRHFYLLKLHQLQKSEDSVLSAALLYLP